MIQSINSVGVLTDAVRAFAKKYPNIFSQPCMKIIFSALDCPRAMPETTDQIETMISILIGKRPIGACACMHITYPDGSMSDFESGILADSSGQYALMYSEEVLETPLMLARAIFFLIDPILCDPAFKDQMEAVREWKNYAMAEVVSKMSPEAKTDYYHDEWRMFIPMFDNLRLISSFCKKEVTLTDQDQFQLRAQALEKACDFLIWHADCPLKDVGGKLSDADKWKFKAMLQFLYHDDKEKAWTKLFEPLFEHLHISEQAWNTAIDLIQTTMQEESLPILQLSLLVWPITRYIRHF